MLHYFPKQFSHTAIYLYLGALAAVTLVFMKYAMGIDFIIMGIVWVVGFFLLTNYSGRIWKDLPERRFLTKAITTAVGLRVVWVFFSFYFYTVKTGIPFEFEAGDSLVYYEEGTWLSMMDFSYVIDYLFTSRDSVADSGYIFYLSIIQRVLGDSIIGVRLMKTVWSGATIFFLYKLAQRNIGEEGARMAATMACFMPNLIVYCGLHLKETEMLFLIVAFLERADYLIRTRKYNVFSIGIPVLLALSLFTFRTVLGGAAVFSFVTALVFSRNEVIGRKKRIMLISWGLLAVFTLTGGTIVNELQSTWDDRANNQTTKRQIQTISGNKWAKYATGSVMAPMIFVLPFPTMVDVANQHNQEVLSGGNYVRNFLGTFVLIALFSAIFVTKNWRDLSLIGSFVIAYLGIISTSGFANSERFLLPGLPVLLIMAAYGLTLLNGKNYQFVKIWYYVVPVMAFSWAFFKVGSRGLF
jgi:hypothetical protein